MQSYGELSLWTRIEGVTSESIRRALWIDRTLVKTWAMRGTLHFLNPADLTLYKAALAGRNARNADLFYKQFGVSLAELEDLADRVGEALAAGESLTRKELAVRVAEPRLLASWGSFLKPASNRGLILFGPPRGVETTFVRTDLWLGEQPAWEREAAQAELLRRYLRAFGPATSADFARWAGGPPPWARPIWAMAVPELVEVEVDGSKAWALATDVAEIQAEEESGQLRLLAGFDTWLLGHVDRSLIFEKIHSPKISRTAGWISALVTVGGRAVGVWTHRVGVRSVTIEVDLFERLDRDRRRQLKAEAESLQSFFGLPCSLGA